MLFSRKQDAVWLIVGLGNPGAEYARTRHNTGFLALDELAGMLGVKVERSRFRALTGTANYRGNKLILMKPQTYMNDSGKAVGPLMHFYKLAPEDLIVAHDDMDIPVGMIRIRKKGSSGGHNGIKSILAHFGDEHFARVRIGIGRPLPGWTVVNHVLAPFDNEGAPKVAEAINYLIPAVECIVNDDVDMAMNKFNPKKQKKKKQEVQEHE